MKKDKTKDVLENLNYLGVLSSNADTKITLEIERRLNNSIQKSKRIIKENKEMFNAKNINYFELFRVFSERNVVINSAIPL